jgi:hypothetical protein
MLSWCKRYAARAYKTARSLLRAPVEGRIIVAQQDRTRYRARTRLPHPRVGKPHGRHGGVGVADRPKAVHEATPARQTALVRFQFPRSTAPGVWCAFEELARRSTTVYTAI